MRLPFRRKVVKRCPEGHEMAPEWRSCPRCSGRGASAKITESRGHLDATVVVTPSAIREARVPEAPALFLRLTVESGARAGETLELLAGRVKFGKSPVAEADARLVKLEDSFMSRDHAAVTVGPGGAVLVDLGSTNGTFVNGRRAERALLEDGDEVRMGQTVLRVSRPAPA